MIVADTSVLIAILRDEPDAEQYLRIIVGADGCLMSSVSVLEASIVLAGRNGDEKVGRGWIAS